MSKKTELKAWLERRAMNYEDLAKGVDISPNYASCVVGGSRDVVSVKIALAIESFTCGEISRFSLYKDDVYWKKFQSAEFEEWKKARAG